MKIIKGHVDWYEGWGNRPGLKLLVSDIPDNDDHRFEKSGDIYFSELDGHVSFFATHACAWPSRMTGKHFDIKMIDGSHRMLAGPWSASSSEVNKAGFTSCIDVLLTDDIRQYNKGYFGIGSCTVELVRQSAHLIDVGARYNDFDTEANFSNGKFCIAGYETNDFSKINDTNVGLISRFPVHNSMKYFESAVLMHDGGIWFKPRM